MSIDDANITAEEAWPGVVNAYDFVLPSYQLLTSRFEAADTRLTALLTLASSLTLGGPLLARAVRPGIAFDSPVFFIAMVFATAGVVLGVIGRIHGRIMLVNPEVLWDKALRESPWEFKKNAVFFAGKHFAANSAAIDTKGRYTLALTIALLIEVWMLTIWIAS